MSDNTPVSPVEAEARVLEKRYTNFKRTPTGYIVRVASTEPDLPFPCAWVDIDIILPFSSSSSSSDRATNSSITTDNSSNGNGTPSATTPLPPLPSLRIINTPGLPGKIVDAMNILLEAHVKESASATPSLPLPLPLPLPLRPLLRWVENSGLGIMLRTVIDIQTAVTTTVTVTADTETEVSTAALAIPGSNKDQDHQLSSSSSTSSHPRKHPLTTSETPIPSSSSSTSSPLPPLDGLQGAFQGQAAWTYAEQEAFERAIYEFFVEPTSSSSGGSGGARLDREDLWRKVTDRVNAASSSSSSSSSSSNASSSIASHHHAQPPRQHQHTIEEVIARYLVLRHICANWYETNVHHPPPDTQDELAALFRRNKNKPSFQPSSSLAAATTTTTAKSITSITAAAAAIVSASSQQQQMTKKSSLNKRSSLSSSSSASTSGGASSTRYGDKRVSLAELDAQAAEDAEADMAAAVALATGKQTVDGRISSTTTAESLLGEVDMFGRAITSSGGSSSTYQEEEEEEPPQLKRRTKNSMKSAHAIIEEDTEEDDDEGEDDEEEDEYVDDDDEDDEEEYDDNDDEEEEEDDTPPPPPLRHVHLTTPHRGWQIMLRKLSLMGIGTLAASTLTVLAQCARCTTVVSATMQGASLLSPQGALAAGGGGGSGAAESGGTSSSDTTTTSATTSSSSTSTSPGEWKAWCPKCALLLSLTYRPTLVHEGNPSLGYIDNATANEGSSSGNNNHNTTTILNLSHTALLASCLECGTFTETPSRLCPPTTWEVSCRTCFSRLRLEARGVDIQQASPDNAQVSGALAAAAAAAAASLSGANKKRAQRFTAGKPLPLEGTCKHYKQSYRWLRFPCCDLAYPCDECHDEVADHPAEWAKRMICGHCAREQLFTQHAPCVSCGESLTRSTRHTVFWEGGSGQRNHASMSKKDPHKFKDRFGMKTRSAKASRVGPKKRNHTSATTAAKK